MPIQKQAVNINFSQGLNTKVDPKQIPVGQFLQLQNTIFTKGGLLQKRNGYKSLTSLPNTSYSYVTTFQNDLTAISNNIAAYSAGNNSWVPKGYIQSLNLSVLPLVRNSVNQTQCDSAIAINGLICTAYTETTGSSTSFKYVIADSITGQNIVEPTLIPIISGTIIDHPRVFLLGMYFVIVFANNVSSVYTLRYVAINTSNPTNTQTGNITTSGAYAPLTGFSWDGAVVNNRLYIAYNSTAGGQSIKVVYLPSTLASATSPLVFSGATDVANLISVCVDNTMPSVPIIYVSFYSSVSTNGYTAVIDQNLNVIHNPTQTISTIAISNLISIAQNGSAQLFYEVINSYSYDSNVASNYIKSVSITQGGSVGTPYVVIRSVGLASKACIINEAIYFLSVYNSAYQSTYFMINGSISIAASPIIIAQLAYQNAGGYLTQGLPNVIVNGNIAQIPYLFRDQIQAVNKNTNVPSGTQIAGIYSQTGVNLASFSFGTNTIATAEIGNDLHISGGFLWMYDGYIPVEHNFFLYPDNIELTPTNSGGAMLAQEYFYQWSYEWSDNQGNLFRSAPSIPVSTNVTAGSGVTFTSNFAAGVMSITVSSASGLLVGMVLSDNTTATNILPNTVITSIVGTTVGLNLPTQGASAGGPGDTLNSVSQGSVTCNVPTLRLTFKNADNVNSVKLVGYRWSAAQQVYYQVTSISIPTLNDTTADSIAFVDTLADSVILGNNVLYTTGGVVENIAAPASNLMTIFDSRLWLIDAENPNLAWFSKQVIQSTPVEMSDLFTVFIAPTTAAQGATGPTTAITVMDDKIIFFKENAIYYLNGTGPDNTGANNQYSATIFINSTVGCTNPNSIVFMPRGIMFQSDKGIWLLGRDLSTEYIGAPVEAFNSSTIQSAVNVPATNQVRFTLNTGQTLMYDYYYNQWGTFINVPAVSSCIYQNLHTFIDSFGAVYQENPGVYLDGSEPVLMSFITGWFNLANLQGYERIYHFDLLGTYISPHKLVVQIAYDYSQSPEQQIVISPNNYSPPYGSDPVYGQSTLYGGSPTLEQWKLHMQRQLCMAFQIGITEIFDSSFGTVAGGGLTLSGINCVVGIKKGWRPIPIATSAG